MRRFVYRGSKENFKIKFSFLKSFICIISFIIIHSSFLIAQTPNQIINSVNQRFNKVKDYSADVNVLCDISFLKITPINAKVFYKNPDHFKVKSKGILIMPKQNPSFVFATLVDTNNITAFKSGEEKIGDVTTQIINVIPNSDTSDLVLGKFWIDDTRGLVLKSQLTTKSQGTILIENSFGEWNQYALPDKMIFTVDLQKFKIPKVVSLDINKSSKESTAQNKKGKITLTFSNYLVNKGVSDNVFKN